MDYIRRIKKNVIRYSISSITFQEEGELGNPFICISPGLQLTGYGNTEEEAMESFNLALQAFLSYSLDRKSLRDNLLRLGWSIEIDEHPNELDHSALNPSFENLWLDKIPYSGISESGVMQTFTRELSFT